MIVVEFRRRKFSVNLHSLTPIHLEAFSNTNNQAMGIPPNTFFLENALKKTTEYFFKFLFYLKVQYFRLIMENNFIQMAGSVGPAVAFTIDPIFKHIIDCVQLYFTNGFTNIVL